MRKIANLSLAVVFVVNGFSASTADAHSETNGNALLSGIVAQDRNSITGFVFTESRQPISDAYVELLTDYNSTISRTKTNGSGLYSFKGLSEGRYSIRVSFLGADYESQTRTVSLIGTSLIRGGGTVNEQVDFYMRPRKTANSGPLAAPGVVFVQEVPAEAQKFYEAGIKELSEKKEKEAFENLKKAVELFPNYFAALDRLGTEYVVRGYYAPAFVLLTKALEINSRSFSSSFGLGLSLYRLNQAGKAAENFQRAIEIYNKSSDAYLWLGIALLEDKKLGAAETALLQANKISKGESPESHWQLARLYKEQKRYQESANELELFLKYSPKAENVEKIQEMIKTLRQKTNGN